MEQIVSVEETHVKDKKCILLRIKGGKQFVMQCEVGRLTFPCFFILTHLDEIRNKKLIPFFSCYLCRAIPSSFSGRKS